MPQDDPVASYLKKYGRPGQRPAQAAPTPDPVQNYLKKYGATNTTQGASGSAIVPNDTTIGPEGIRANDEVGKQRYLDSLNTAGARRDSVARARGVPAYSGPVIDMTPRPRVQTPAAGRGAPGFSLNTEAQDIARGIGKTLYGGAVGTADLASKLNPFNINEWMTRPREQIKRSGEAVTFPIAAAKHTRDVTQRALAGEDVTPGEIAEAWSGGAFGLLGAVEGVRGLPDMLPRRGTARAPVAPSARPPVPYELEPIEAGFPTKPTPPTRPKGTKATRAELDKVITQQRSTLTPSPAELDALIQQQQAELQQGIAGPAERPGKVPAQNPLTETDNHIAQLQEEIARLRAEHEAMVAERERGERPPPPPSTPEQKAPDALRDLPDEALGETPPPEQSAAAAQDAKIPGIAERILQEERRKGQQPFEGAEQRAPERLQALLDEASRRMAAMEQRHALQRKGFMGTGAKSMTPEDVAQTRIIGEIKPKELMPGMQIGPYKLIEELNKPKPGVQQGEVVGEIKPPPAPEHVEGVPGSQALHEHFEAPETQALIRQLGPERLPGESVLDYSRRIREQVEPEDVRTPGTVGGEMPPLPPEKPAAPIDMTGIDVQIEALRAEQERLRADAERAKVEHPGSHPSFARKERLAAKGGAGAEAKAAREKLPSRRELQAEIRSLQGTLRMVEKTLQRYPESDTRPHAVEYRNELLHTKLAAMERLNEVMELKKGTPYKRPPLKGPKGTMGPNLGGEGGFALNPFAKKPAAPRTVAQRLVDKQIGVGELAERTPLRVRWHQLIQNLTETSHYVGKLERIAAKHGRKLPISQRARLFMKAALDSPKRISGALYEGGPGYFDPATGAWTPLDSPSLEAVIKPIAGDVEALQDVRRLLVAEHNPAMLAAGRETGISPAAATDIVQRAKPRTLSIATGMRNWLNATVEGAVRVGALPRSLLDIWQKKYPHYIPAERVFEGEGAVRGGSGSTRSSVRPPARRAKKGGEQPYADPFETIPDYGARWIRYTDLYQATRSTLDLVTQNRDLWGDLAVKVNEKPLAQVNAVEHISELLSDRALRLEGDQVKMYNPKTNTIETWKLEPILADGLRALSGREWDFVTEFLGAAKRGVQFGVTNNPFFGLANWLRDNAGRPVMSGATNYPLANTIGESPLYKTMGGGFGVAEESGGFFEGLRRSVPGRSKLRSAQRARQGRAAKLTGTTPTAIRTMRALPEALKLMSVPFEEATRGAEFRAQKAKGLSDLEAYVNAQEVLGNFAEHGTAAWVRWLSHVTPFLNPRVQGLRAFYDAGTRRPGGTALKAALTITIPSVALYALQQDDQEIEDLRNGPGGYNSWFIRPSNILPNAPNDVILRVPKPFLPGALGSTSVEHALDALRDRDPHAFKRMLSDVGNELWQSSINPALGVPQALATNKAIGTGVPIVPEEQKGYLPEEQTGTHPNYSLQEVSRSLPEPLRFSPARAQYALGQFGGTAGRELPNLMDILRHAERLPERRGLADVPGVSRFFARTPTSAAAPIRDVYDDARRGNQIMETLKGLTAAGDAAGISRLIQDHGPEFGTAMRDQIFTEQLSKLGNLAQYFANSESLSPHERRMQRDEMLRAETELARRFHEIMHEK